MIYITMMELLKDNNEEKEEEKKNIYYYISNFDESLSNGDVCPICLEDFGNGINNVFDMCLFICPSYIYKRIVKIKKCCHVFHEKCIDSFIKAYKNKDNKDNKNKINCPVCRTLL